MADKRMTADDIVAHLEDGMTIGIGGWGSRRKPMALVYAIARSSLKDLTIVSYGGPGLGILCRLGKVKKAVYGFVSLDSIPLEPNFRRARQNAEIEVAELDEGMFLTGLEAAARRLPFMPTRAGLGSDVMKYVPELKTIKSPYEDGEEFVAMPALRLDAALIHLNRGDERGNGMYLGTDPYFDDLYSRAADKVFMSVEKIVPTEELAAQGPSQAMLINRMMVTGVIEAPGGGGFTDCSPDYGRDEAAQGAYNKATKTDETWQAWVDANISA